jgi:hypothetical protein
MEKKHSVDPAKVIACLSIDEITRRGFWPRFHGVDAQRYKTCTGK